MFLVQFSSKIVLHVSGLIILKFTSSHAMLGSSWLPLEGGLEVFICVPGKTY